MMVSCDTNILVYATVSAPFNTGRAILLVRGMRTGSCMQRSQSSAAQVKALLAGGKVSRNQEPEAKREG